MAVISGMAVILPWDARARREIESGRSRMRPAQDNSYLPLFRAEANGVPMTTPIPSFMIESIPPPSIGSLPPSQKSSISDMIQPTPKPTRGTSAPTIRGTGAPLRGTPSPITNQPIGGRKVCPNCNASFSAYSELQSHKAKCCPPVPVVEEKAPYLDGKVCVKCNTSFWTYTELERHKAKCVAKEGHVYIPPKAYSACRGHYATDGPWVKKVVVSFKSMSNWGASSKTGAEEPYLRLEFDFVIDAKGYIGGASLDPRYKAYRVYKGYVSDDECQIYMNNEYDDCTYSDGKVGTSRTYYLKKSKTEKFGDLPCWDVKIVNGEIESASADHIGYGDCTVVCTDLTGPYVIPRKLGKHSTEWALLKNPKYNPDYY